MEADLLLTILNEKKQKLLIKPQRDTHHGLAFIKRDSLVMREDLFKYKRVKSYAKSTLNF